MVESRAVQSTPVPVSASVVADADTGTGVAEASTSAYTREGSQSGGIVTVGHQPGEL